MKKMNRSLTKNDIIEIAKNKGIKLHDDHPVPTTRRQFLANGLLGFSATLVAPSLMTLVTQNAQAQSVAECTAMLTPTDTMPGFLHINLGGGAGNTGQWMVQKVKDSSRPLATINDPSNLEPINNYDRLGLGDGRARFNVTGNVDGNNPGTSATRFANNFPAVQGVDNNGTPEGARLFTEVENIAATASRNTAVTGIAVASQDDTASNNKFGPQGILHSVQRAKDIKFRISYNMSNSSGTSLTGLDQDVSGRNRPYAPIVANSLNDVKRVIGEQIGNPVEGGSNVVLAESEKKKMLEVINKLSGEQSRNVATVGSGSRENFIKLYKEASGKSYCQLIVPQTSVDPRDNATLATMWDGITFEEGRNNNRKEAYSALIYAAVQGWSGTVGIDLGGYDYHGNDRTNETDPKDADAGRLVGAALRTAEILDKPLFVMITSDGATGSQASTNAFPDWQSDRGNGGCILTFMYDPRNAAGQAKEGYLANVDIQLGEYTDGQSAKDDTLVGSPERATQAVVHRFLAFAELSDWKTVVKAIDDRAGFTTAELDYIAKFGA